MNIIAELKKLSKAELDEVITAARALKQFADGGPQREPAPASRQAGTDPHDYVLDVLCQVCRETGKDLRAIPQVKLMPAYATFKNNIAAVLMHIRTFADPQAIWWQDRSIERALFRLTYTHMAIEHGMGLALLLSNTSQLPRYMDELFPGYYAAGLMPHVLKAMKR